MHRFIPERYLHITFVIGLAFKTFNGFLEILLGVALYFTTTIQDALQTLVQAELIEDPNDRLANIVENVLNFNSGHHYFVSLYLLGHGSIKLLILVGLIRKKLWAYPIALGVFAGFIIYQLHRYTISHSPWLLVFTALDVIFVWLMWHEYIYRMRKIVAAKKEPPLTV